MALLAALAMWIAAPLIGFLGRNSLSWAPTMTAAALWFVGLGFYLAAVLT